MGTILIILAVGAILHRIALEARRNIMEIERLRREMWKPCERGQYSPVSTAYDSGRTAQELMQQANAYGEYGFHNDRHTLYDAALALYIRERLEHAALEQQATWGTVQVKKVAA